MLVTFSKPEQISLWCFLWNLMFCQILHELLQVSWTLSILDLSLLLSLGKIILKGLHEPYNCEMLTVNCYLQNTCRVWVGSSLWTLSYLVNSNDAATTYVFGFLFLAEMFISQRTLPAWLLALLLSIAFQSQDSLVSSAKLQTLTRWN